MKINKQLEDCTFKPKIIKNYNANKTNQKSATNPIEQEGN